VTAASHSSMAEVEQCPVAEIAAPEPMAEAEQCSAAEAEAPQPMAEGEQCPAAEAAAPKPEAEAEQCSTAEAEAPQPMAGVEQCPAAEAAAPKPEAEAEQCSAVQAAAPQPSVGLKRKRSVVKTVSLEALAAKIKQLEQEATQKETAVAEMEASIVAKRAEAVAKRAEARKVGQDYVRRQCEEALSKLDGSVPKRIANPFAVFRQECFAQMKDRQESSEKAECGARLKEISALWAALSDAEKKVYQDKYEQGNKKFKEWGDSEEGKRILAERNEVLRKVKAAEAEQLAGALGSKAAPAESATSTPSKGRAAEQKAEVEATPPKQRKVEPRVARPSVVPAKIVTSAEAPLDESIVAEAEKAELLAPLRNLAGRPDVRSLGKTDAELLEALKAHGGMVNSAKRALFGEA